MSQILSVGHADRTVGIDGQRVQRGANGAVSSNTAEKAPVARKESIITLSITSGAGAAQRLAAALVTDDSVAGVTIGADALTVSASDYGTFTRLLPRVARAEKVRLREVLPTDESLESVFSYLVAS